MSTELPKAYDPAAVELAVDKVWNDEKLFHAEAGDPGAPFSIVIPPPNVTAALHLGHALNNTLQDILTRWHRMKGENACWFPGTDHAGIATQTVVEKRVLAEEGKRRTDFSREEFVGKIQAWKDEYEKRITEQLERMGCSCDFARQAFTMDPTRARAVREAFFRLFKDGLIYRGKRLVNWDPATQTALADDEVEMEEVDGHFYYLKYPVEDEQGSGFRVQGSGEIKFVTVATTRPETMLGDTAVAINPKDPRAAALRGKKVRLPIVNRVVPIIEDDYVVMADANSADAKAQFATGFLKVTPAHDPNDYEIGLRHPEIGIINVFSPTATISREHGWPAEDFARGDDELRNLLGMDRFEARRAIVEWFKSEKLLEEIKPYRHSVGHSYRSHVPIEPYLSDQWYVATTKQIGSMPEIGNVDRTEIPKNSLAGMALRAIRDTGILPVQSVQHGQDAHVTKEWEGKLRIVPERYAKTYQSWHENIRDWCISRQLWWGHRIPVWSGLASEEHRDFIENVAPQWDAEAVSRGEVEYGSMEGGSQKWHHWCRAVRRQDGWYIWHCVAPGYSQVERELEKQGYIQDPDVLDTWFSSGLWPMSTMGWPEETAELAKWNPTSVLCTAREIITLWVSRMVMFNLYFLNRLPFYEVFVHAMIQDGEGRKMSKSLGNGVDPVDIIESHGADAMRFTLCAMTTHTQDVRMPVEKDAKSGKNTSPKFDNGRNFCNKLWNAARFAMMNLTPSPLVGEGGGEGESRTNRSPSIRESTLSDRSSVTPHPNPSLSRYAGAQGERGSLPDRWIVSRFNRTVGDAIAAMESYRYDAYAKACYDFFWGDFCDWYLEAIKPAMKDPQRAGATADVLAAVLDGALRLMHPMIPFITEFIWWKLNEIRPERNLAGRIECKASARLIKASFPAVGEFSEEAEGAFAQLQEIVGTIRNVRNEYKVDPKKPVTVSIVLADEAARQVEENREIVELLGTCRVRSVGPGMQAPAESARAVAGGGEIFIEGLVDRAAEEQRVGKRCDELKRQQAALRGRLANEAYTAKAPAHLVQQTRDQLAEVEAEMGKLGCG